VTFTYTWEDCLGNPYTWDYVFTVLDPVVTIPDNQSEDVECYTDVYVPLAPDLYDNCNRLLVKSGPVEGGTFDGCEGTVTYTWTYTDCLENPYYWVYTFNVEDVTPPEFANCPVEIIDLECNPEMLPTAEMAIEAVGAVTDNCDPDVDVRAEKISSSGECDFTEVWLVTADADCGPDATCEVTFIWEIETISGNCETAFGRMDDDVNVTLTEGALCFQDEALVTVNGNTLFNRWGWSNRITVPNEDRVMNLYPGAAHCNTDGIESVGTVTVKWYSDGDSVTVDYLMEPGQYLSEVHIYVGYERFPTISKGSKLRQTVAPGQYTLVQEAYDGEYYTDVHAVFTGVTEAFWVIAHGVVCPLECVCGEGEVLADGTIIIDGVEADMTVYEELDVNASKLNASQNVGPRVTKKSAELATGVLPELESGDLKVYPNPFNEVVNIEFVSPVSGHAVLEIHNMVGQRVATLLDDYVEAGVENKVQFRPDAEVSGFYLYRLDIDGNIQIGKMVYRKE